MLYHFLMILTQIFVLKKCIECNFLNMQCLKITIYFSYFLKSVFNVLKLILWPVFEHPDVL